MKNILWGIVLVVAGALLGCRAAGLIDSDAIFFDGWWTLFIIVPCAICAVTEKGHRVGNLIGLIVGVLLLLSCQDLISFEIFWKLLIPGIIVIIGLSLIFKTIFNQKISADIKKLSSNIDDAEISAVFSGQNVNMKGEKFNGKKVSAVFGGLKLDLREAIIKEDAVIDASAVFGGIDILVPSDINVKIKSSAVFGGVKNNSRASEADEKKPTLYINGSAMFGGIEIK